ncbi:hypothetical protein EUGRSUZ_B00696 [Eucalyptus grandis]|uniref:Uncharacterized protein n=2 Tax=Eucalyptus grandis TaxID=71139 RepID=A0A059CZA7_EUCGR|nr:hypothetical protein EUGRSUZ_B00696 [Eucalyptus grandis]
MYALFSFLLDFFALLYRTSTSPHFMRSKIETRGYWQVKASFNLILIFLLIDYTLFFSCVGLVTHALGIVYLHLLGVCICCCYHNIPLHDINHIRGLDFLILGA